MGTCRICRLVGSVVHGNGFWASVQRHFGNSSGGVHIEEPEVWTVGTYSLIYCHHVVLQGTACFLINVFVNLMLDYQANPNYNKYQQFHHFQCKSFVMNGN